MADSKISALTTATTPLAGTEVLPIVQSGATKKTTVSDLLLDGSVTPTKLSTGHPSWTTTGHQSATSTTDANTAANVQTYSKNITNSKAAIRIQDTASSATTAFKADRNGYDSRAYISVTNTSQTEFDAVAVYGDTGNVNINTGNLVIGTSGKGITTGSAIPLGLGTNNAVASATIHNSGGVSIGNTTDPGAGNLSVNKNIFANNRSTTYGSVAGFVADTTGSNVQAFTTNSYTSNAYYIGRFYYGGTEKGYIYTDGSTVSFTSISDYRAKTNVAPMLGALSKISQLNPVTFDWIDSGKSGQGFIAHELQSVVPDCVTGEKDAIDENGKPIYQGVDASFLVATLTKAIQEQQSIIESLSDRISILENK